MSAAASAHGTQRTALLDAAVELFGERGYEAASTRDIAARCGVAMSAITYHFGGKEGLYLATADHIVEAMRVLGCGVDEPLSPDPASVDEACDRLIAMLADFAIVMLRPESERLARFVVREQQQPTEAFERIWAGMMAPMMSRALRLVAQCRPDLPPLHHKALLIELMGMVLVLRFSRATLCRLFAVGEITPDVAATLQAQLRASASALLSKEPS